MDRRNFLALCAIAGVRCTAVGRETAPESFGLKVALNAYSFNKLLNDSIRRRGPGITLPGLLDFCALHRFEGLDATGYYFPGYPKVPPDSYVESLKRRAADLRIGISGTGVRNNFTTSDPAARAADVRHIKEWVRVAAQLGAPVLRVFADTQIRSMTWETAAKGYSREQVQEWMAAALKECADCGRSYGVRIGVQNHGDFLKTGQDVLALVNAVGSDWCGPLVDTGYFRSADPYADIALVAPRAVSWQIKESPFGQESEIPTDLTRLLRIIRASGYRGYLPIETLSSKGKDADPHVEVPKFLKKLRRAIAETA